MYTIESFDTSEYSQKLTEARRIVDAADLGELQRAFRLKQEAVGYSLPGGENAWCNLDDPRTPTLQLGVRAINKRGYGMWEPSGDDTYLQPLHVQSVMRRATTIATNRYQQILEECYGPGQEVERRRPGIDDERQATAEIVREMFEQEGSYREFEGYIFTRVGGKLRMAPDGPALRKALQSSRLKEIDDYADSVDAQRRIGVPFHPSFQMPVERDGDSSIAEWHVHSGLVSARKYWRDADYEYSLQEEAAALLKRDADSSATRVDITRPESVQKELPELSPRAELVIAARAVDTLLNADDSVKQGIDPELLQKTMEKARGRLHLLREKVLPREVYDGTNAAPIAGFESATDDTEQFAAVTTRFTRTGTSVLDAVGSTRILLAGDEQLPRSEDIKVTDYTPAERAIVRAALMHMAEHSTRKDFSLEARDMLDNGKTVNI